MTNEERYEIERQLFEDDAQQYGFDLSKVKNLCGEPWADYADDDTGHRWAGWLAARGVEMS
jgi:hypothetical protein